MKLHNIVQMKFIYN